MKAVSPVVAVIVLIAVAIIGALLLGHYLPQMVKSGASKGAMLSISDAELYFISGGSWNKYYMLSLRVANTGSDTATVEKVEIWGQNSWGSPTTFWSKNLNKQVHPGEIYSDSWTFSTSSWSSLQVGQKYVVKIKYTDQWGNEKTVSIIVKCKGAG